MARILVSAMPFTGHVTPLVAVAEQLVARGHDVRFYTGSAFRARVEASGAALVPWRAAPDFDENDLPATFPRLTGKKGLAQLLVNMEDLFIDTAPRQFADLEAEWRRSPWDVMVADETSVGVVLTAQRLGIPWATIAVLPLNLAGTQGPPSGMGLIPGTDPLTRLRDAALRAAVPVMTRPLRKPLARARAAVGVAPSSLTMDEMVFSPLLVAASGSSSLDYGRADRPATLEFVGELRSDSRTDIPLPVWWGDLDGRTIVHVTQGTQNNDPADLIRPALEALADLDVLVVVTTGVRERDTLPFAVSADVRVAGLLPYAELLPRAAVVVTNGGWGGTLAALGHGIPLVVAGGDLDKPEVAARVAWSGAGVNLRTGTPTAAHVHRAVERVLADSSIRDAAQRVGAELRALGGAARAAELVEALVPRVG
jgi:MGT family glycosyltransferase